ncbi:MAG: hypothetical protein JSV68_22640 [Anaerolineaceae bacterium]|nr:MAG: hypothetical protein JSV68_22640 [Anaerolineaceae bacterium]
MSTLATFSQHWSVSGQYSRFQDNLQNHGAAMKSYNRAKKRGAWRRLKARLTGRSVQLLHYPTTGRQSEKHAPGCVHLIALDQIIGSEGRSHDFDDQFWPLTEHSRDRWLSIAMAMGTGKPLPPVQLLKSDKGYIVRDGHHRLSVARAFGQEVIEAEVI